MTDFTVVVDTREQLPYIFGPGVETVEKTLETGDYSVEGYEDVFAVERKSLPDLLKSITWDRDRFKREVVRGDDLVGFVVVIESSLRSVNNWEYEREVHPNSVTGTVNNWEKYHNVDFEWAGDRAGAEAETLRTLERWYNSYRALYD